MSVGISGKKVFIPSPPEKGSFPLDHDNECKRAMLGYLQCLREHRLNSSECRAQAKAYLKCRMDNDLMAKEEWKNLGFHENEEDHIVYEVFVEQLATVLDLKKAIKRKFSYLQQRAEHSAIPRKVCISWRYIWKRYTLCFENKRLSDDKSKLADYDQNVDRNLMFSVLKQFWRLKPQTNACVPSLRYFSDGKKSKLKSRTFPEATHPNTPLGKMDRQPKKEERAKSDEQSDESQTDAFAPFPNSTNPVTGEIGGPTGPEPTRYGDWERKGRVTDF
ncbi:cytochrome c oxidase assembly protein COX19-like protein [Dinothrombium tinctorium]|uniref:Cytochrome c oxidase assembly protein COX19-like protein n=1 Tax=Dinothrombium tinctorium TaxID=1965070 RepID=A0A3S3SME1_9ACAR|nr:cytochrome c oxidase assembly protein COX19-like protein [Dinothrombium tinctorium]